MAVPAEDSLFKTPWPMWTVLQHLDVVIRLQHQHVRGPDPLEHQSRRMTQVSKNANIPACRTQQEPHGILRIVWDTERVHRNISYFETCPRAKEPPFASGVHLALDRFLRRPIAIDRDAQLLGERQQALHMIRMLMRDQDAREVFRRSTKRGEPFANLSRAESGIDQDARLFGLHIGTIAGGTAAKNRQSNRH